jgi:hypothetical protein
VAARFDHLVVAVADLDDAIARWTAAGLPAARGGAHPVGTVNALVRGPGPAYVELIAPGSDEANPWLDRVRSASGPISWALAVDDIEVARTALVAAGFQPDPAVPGSRRTPTGDVLEWKVCDLGPGPYDGLLPFLIEWTTPMEPGPADGPVLEWVMLTPSDPDPVADVLLALGFTGDRHFPRRVFPGGEGVSITLAPLGEPEHADEAAWMSIESDEPQPPVSIVLATSVEGSVTEVLDEVEVTTRPDRRRFPAAALVPAVDVAFARLRGDLADWPHPRPGSAPPVTSTRARCAGRGTGSSSRPGSPSSRDDRVPVLSSSAPHPCTTRTTRSCRSEWVTPLRSWSSSRTAGATPATRGLPTCSGPSTTRSCWRCRAGCTPCAKGTVSSGERWTAGAARA